ncbi:lipopolysaccharide biosynthesis protein [Microbacterium sp. SA39]|uniref:lipopolysaccharide biosynthesis protein n=1 Tax=Microbacterium sp. SA39 TaxID=1263625 RepID=UPI0005FA5804|nr:oligosaccharide flippase family protein [Microbacterium sp. SA39]KJQ55084.1 Polysaccharide biosynthesis protein [Microbacterium sp. SA39]
MSRERWLVVGGQAAGQLATVATLPLLTRVLEPELMGLYQAAFAIGVILQPVASLRLEFLLPAVRGEVELRRLVRFSIWSQVICGVIAVALFAVLGLTGKHDASQIALMSGLIMVAYAWTVVDNALLVRQGAMHRLAVRNLLAGLLTAGLQILVALTVPNIFLLALSILIGRAVAILLTRRRAERSVTASLDQVEDVPWTGRRAVYSVLSGLVSSASLQGLTVYVTVGFGAAAAGAVGVAQRSASAPVAFLSQGLSQYSQAKIAAVLRSGEGEARREILHQIRGTLPIAALATVGLAVLGPLLAPFVFGPGWGDVGPVIALLALPIGLQLLLSPVMSVFVMLGRERLLLGVQVVRLAISLAGALIAQILTGDVLLTVLGFAIGTAVGYVFTLVAVWRLIRRP